LANRCHAYVLELRPRRGASKWLKPLPLSSRSIPKKQLLLTAVGDDGHNIVAEMTVDDIAELMATLSQCQHALVLSHAGMEVLLPVDPTIAFEPVAGGYALGVFEAHWQHALGIDTELGAVELQLLSRKGRLTNIALTPDAARRLGAQLLQLADRVPPSQKLQ
jgi:hypothetical protein